MRFRNKAGQTMNLINNLTIKELLDMGIELVLSEKINPGHKFYGLILEDHLTIQELDEMGVEMTISEKTDPEHELWLAA